MTYYETTLFLGFGVMFWVSGAPTHRDFEKNLYMIFGVRYAFLKVPHPQLPNERVSFGAPPT